MNFNVLNASNGSTYMWEAKLNYIVVVRVCQHGITKIKISEHVPSLTHKASLCNTETNHTIIFILWIALLLTGSDCNNEYSITKRTR